MPVSNNFSLRNATGIVVSVTPTSQAIMLPNRTAEDVMIVNQSQTTVFVTTGDENIVAVKNVSMPILPGEKGVYSKGLAGGDTTHIAFVTDVSNVDVTFFQGLGA